MFYFVRISFFAAIILHVQSQQFVNLKMNNRTMFTTTRGNVHVCDPSCGCVAFQSGQIKAAKCRGIEVTSQHWGFPWIFESNCTSWRFLQTQQWFVTKFWSRCCWLVSLSSAGYIWIIQVLLDVPFWGFQWISNITNPDGCWTSYRIVVGWWDDISLPLSSLHSVWLETCLQRPNRYDIFILVFSITKHTNQFYSYGVMGVSCLFPKGSAPIFDDWFRSPQRDDSSCVFMCFSAGSGSKQLQTEWTDFSNQNH
jgi:hypothetical protein